LDEKLEIPIFRITDTMNTQVKQMLDYIFEVDNHAYLIAHDIVNFPIEEIFNLCMVYMTHRIPKGFYWGFNPNNKEEMGYWKK
jgi:hypothetical protein